MPANPTEVMTEDATMKAMVDRFLTWKLPQSFNPDCGITFTRGDRDYPHSWPIGTNLFTATEARQMLEHVLGDTLTSLRSSRDDAVKERDQWREACQQNAEAIDLIHGAFQSEVPAWDGEKYSSYAEWGVRAGKRALELIAERDAARAEVSRLSGELASRPAKELVEAARKAQLWISNGTESTTMADRIALLEELHAAIKRATSEAHEPAKEKCKTCDGSGHIRSLGRDNDEIIEDCPDCDSALSQASSADALSAPAKDARPLQNPPCPKCGKPLHRVRNVADSMLNDEQFDSVKAGDWYCDSCPDNGRGKSACCYFWDREVFSPAPVAAPASAVSPASEEKDAKVPVCPKCCKRYCICELVRQENASVSPTPAPAPSDGSASEERDAMGELVLCDWDGLGTCPKCGQEHGRWIPGFAPTQPLVQKPAPSSPSIVINTEHDAIPIDSDGKVRWSWTATEDYPGVRVWRDVIESKQFLWFWTGSETWCASGDASGGFVQHSDKFPDDVLTDPDCEIVELHGPERLAVIEKALTLKPDLFGAPGAAKKDHLQEGAEKVAEFKHDWVLTMKFYGQGPVPANPANIDLNLPPCDVARQVKIVSEFEPALDAMNGGANG